MELSSEGSGGEQERLGTAIWDEAEVTKIVQDLAEKIDRKIKVSFHKTQRSTGYDRRKLSHAVERYRQTRNENDIPPRKVGHPSMFTAKELAQDKELVAARDITKNSIHVKEKRAIIQELQFGHALEKLGPEPNVNELPSDSLSHKLDAKTVKKNTLTFLCPILLKAQKHRMTDGMKLCRTAIRSPA